MRDPRDTRLRLLALLTSTEIAKALKAKFAAIVADGQGEMKGSLFRVAHLGYFDYMDTLAIIGALEHVMFELAGGFELGAALTAAQQEYAARTGTAAMAAK